VDIILLVLHVVLSLGIITLVLLQKGAGASAGASFGGSGAGSVFGATGSANFLSKSTAILAICFFLNSLALAYLAAHREVKTDSVLDILTAPQTEVPASGSAAPAAESPLEESDVPLADIPESADVPSVQDATGDGNVPAAETADAPSAEEAPSTAVPATDVPQPAGE
jgi:preprotein translocase subunit SecG